jgi:hypothetical protein
MLAIVAAVIFGIALLLDLLNIAFPSALSVWTFTFAGLLFLALHLGGVGTYARSWRRRR